MKISFWIFVVAKTGVKITLMCMWNHLYIINDNNACLCYWNIHFKNQRNSLFIIKKQFSLSKSSKKALFDVISSTFRTPWFLDSSRTIFFLFQITISRCLQITVSKVSWSQPNPSIWMSKNCQKLDIFFKKIAKNCQWQIFDSQMAIFRRVRCWVWLYSPMG